MIKILFLIHDLGHGGAEKVLVNLVNNMDRKRFEISVVALFGGGVNEQYLRADVHYYSVFSKSIPGNSKLMKFLTPEQLHKMCIKDTYDIEVAYLEGPATRVISGCTNKDTKLVSWIHVEQHNQKIAAKAFRSYAESVSCYKKFDKIVCVSEAVKQDFMRIYPMFEEVDVFYNTNETDQIIKMKEEKIEEGIFRKNEIKICGVGKIMPIKGFDKLARIHNRLIKEKYPIHTYVLGKGSERGKIEAYLVANHIEDTFSFLGYQTNPYKYVANSDMFVCASSSEGFSTAATEALIVGTPVVTTPVAGMKEMLGENNEYGIVLPDMSEESLYRNIKELLDCPEKLLHYQSQAKIRGACFSKERTVSAVEKMFMSLM